MSYLSNMQRVEFSNWWCDMVYESESRWIIIDYNSISLSRTGFCEALSVDETLVQEL